jgi:hypothetical protein
MRDKNRIKKLLKEIERHWNTHPDMRFGQLLIVFGICEVDMRTWNQEDEEIIKL